MIDLLTNMLTVYSIYTMHGYGEFTFAKRVTNEQSKNPNRQT